MDKEFYFWSREREQILIKFKWIIKSFHKPTQFTWESSTLFTY